MRVEEFAKELELVAVSGFGANAELSGAYIGDLLSVVMSKCEAGNAWITVQTHANIVSVANLNDAACIIIAGGAAIDKSLIEKAEEAGVCILRTDREAYELAWRIHEVLK